MWSELVPTHAAVDRRVITPTSSSAKTIDSTLFAPTAHTTHWGIFAVLAVLFHLVMFLSSSPAVALRKSTAHTTISVTAMLFTTNVGVSLMILTVSRAVTIRCYIWLAVRIPAAVDQ